ncbi:MAG TPA: hypothetical protein EYH56_01580, partial [Nanoarchaeota archaeon]|nr:hypothetical protein [Nanoarchaeota archaeon]
MLKLSKCKAQFFIISAALVIASISAIALYLQSLYHPSLTYPSTKIELEYIPQIKKLLCEAAKSKHAFSQDLFDKNLKEVERTLKQHLASQGIMFSVAYDYQENDIVFNFNLTSYGFKSQTIFSCFAPEERIDLEWRYRRIVIIRERSGNTLTDYQVLLTVDTQNLINQGKMRSDCG